MRLGCGGWWLENLESWWVAWAFYIFLVKIFGLGTEWGYDWIIASLEHVRGRSVAVIGRH